MTREMVETILQQRLEHVAQMLMARATERMQFSQRRVYEDNLPEASIEATHSLALQEVALLLKGTELPKLEDLIP